jgi:hypothetical protein
MLRLEVRGAKFEKITNDATITDSTKVHLRVLFMLCSLHGADFDLMVELKLDGRLQGNGPLIRDLCFIAAVACDPHELFDETSLASD